MHSMMMSLMVLGIVISAFLFVGWIIWLVGRLRRERQQRDVELRTRMLEKFGSSEEFVGFMQTDAGRRFLDTAGSRGEKSLRARVASSLASGGVLLMLGIAFFFLSWIIGEDAMLFPGAILSAVGIGLAISAFVYAKAAPDPSEDDIEIL